MKNWFKQSWDNLFIRCPKTNRILAVNYKASGKLLLPVLGILSIIWILVRLLPKPSRAVYPCMRVAVPIASGFVLYVGGLLLSIVAFKKAHDRFRNHKYIVMGMFVLVGMLGSLFWVGATDSDALAKYYHEVITPNAPIGEAHGIFPGRVVWAWDPDATNENCTNRANRTDASKDDGWFLPKNNNQEVIDKMLSDVLQNLTGTTTDKDAWDAVFRYNNQMRGKGDVGYQEGEVVYIKINATSSYNWNRQDFSVQKNNQYGIAETNPHLVLSVLRHLVNVVGVVQEDIWIGDPLKHVYKHCYDLWIAEFPQINVLDVSENRMGRRKIIPMNRAIMKYSDKAEILHEGDWSNPWVGNPTVEDVYCQTAEICEYLINIPTMKAHRRAGITMFAKNHFGSHTRENAVHLHNGLVDPCQDGIWTRFERNQYRVQVDLMGHEIHYKKGLFYLMDALYSGSEATDPPRKFKMAPFNNDWTSSLFISLDPVAIESVGFDFLRTEYDENSDYPYPVMPAVDDYLHQAADKSEWPEGIVYDPEGDGTPIPVLGVHEHWNNAVDKQYTRDLGTGQGIELVKLTPQTGVKTNTDGLAQSFMLHQNYPNPFNPATTIRVDLDRPAKVQLAIYNMSGQRVYGFGEEFKETGSHDYVWNGQDDNSRPAPSGVYLYRITINDGIQTRQQARQMVLLK